MEGKEETKVPAKRVVPFCKCDNRDTKPEIPRSDVFLRGLTFRETNRFKVTRGRVAKDFIIGDVKAELEAYINGIEKRVTTFEARYKPLLVKGDLMKIEDVELFDRTLSVINDKLDLLVLNKILKNLAIHDIDSKESDLDKKVRAAEEAIRAAQQIVQNAAEQKVALQEKKRKLDSDGSGSEGGKSDKSSGRDSLGSVTRGVDAINFGEAAEKRTRIDTPIPDITDMEIDGSIVPFLREREPRSPIDFDFDFPPMTPMDTRVGDNCELFHELREEVKKMSAPTAEDMRYFLEEIVNGLDNDL